MQLENKTHKMKTIYLIRHAKSSWKDSLLSDHERPLNQRGLHDAPLMGQKLKNLFKSPEKIICSSANRTLQTASLIGEIWFPSTPIEKTDLLYQQPTSVVLDLIQSSPSKIKSLAIIFHNPTITHLTNLLCSTSLFDLPTCSVVVASCDSKNWNSVNIGKCNLEHFDYPKKNKND